MSVLEGGVASCPAAWTSPVCPLQPCVMAPRVEGRGLYTGQKGECDKCVTARAEEVRGQEEARLQDQLCP